MIFLLKRNLASLDAEAERLLSRQTARNPLRPQIGDLIARYQVVVDQPACTDRALIAMAKLHESLADPVAALQALCRVTEGASPAYRKKAATQALPVVRLLRTRKYRIQKKDSAVQSSLESSIGTIIARTQDLEISRRIEVHFLLFRGEARAALERAFHLALTSKAGLTDFMTVAKVIFHRGDAEKYIDDLARMMQQLAPALRKAKSGTFLIDVRIGQRGVIIRNGCAVPLSLDGVMDALATASPADILALVSEKPPFLFRYPDCEPIKQAILDRFLPMAKGAGAVKKCLEKMAQSETFWRDPLFRDRILADLLHRLGRNTGPEAELTRGSIALIRGELENARIHFARSVQKNTSFEEGGATSFFLDLTAKDEKEFTQVAVDFSDVERAPIAYVCCADLPYFARYARKYVASLRDAGNGTRIHFHLSAPSHTIARNSVTEHLGDFDNISVSSELSKLHVPTYYASMRFLRAADFLAHVADRVFLTDIDVAFHSTPAAFTHAPIWNDTDLGLRIYDKVRVLRQAVAPGRELFRYPRLVPWAQVNAACVALLNTPRGRAAADTISRAMHRHLGRALSERDTAWWIDQNMLFLALLELKADPGMRVVNIEDIGLPFGSFSYAGSITMPGGHPLLVTSRS
ncbi:hypothetical protein [Gluconacetobacter tumulisoli]|uniref:Uncharacterized protein n=1 Tax=Gluconacetobacter tumulisoli TaxID=1286189 RepID=A0A7W4PK82_9PROT|nr:hypothetical protein [Gluconacetobacter tumulisoli]MBB2201127.1 hypothetical protein [Gluconacetobacter tumulisoli]